ncbi:pyruvate, phosphate dikinase [Aeromicrobium ginsengisoli]|uniref:Pyruvate, phosphate dikinase n=1 Tax=Aeromicrobium ginsengisoli TaxID=363867 RepID=A0A5M4FGA5_9ACTN|nr:pyruvate, phosphate dikinase [Aeromicrobium ginsengisoli]KAA1398190.1 pyruvate, phosphate dikinase [Aeromicrobium ginsengisoli]
MTQYVYDFSEGGMDQKDLLGGKGANLAEMTNLGLPVPPGFTISTEACRAYMTEGKEPDGLSDEVSEHLKALEQARGNKLGDPGDPLLVSVRSGAKFSMPGMMETVLNVGLNDESVKGLAQVAGGDERFAYDSYRRLLQMFGSTVLGIEASVFAEALDALKADRKTGDDLDLTAEDLQGLIETYKGLIAEHGGRDFPQDPREQLDMAVLAVFDSWNTERAALYRRQERIPDDLGTAVNICSMVFGNGGDDSGTGVAFTRDPATGAQGLYGDYLVNAQGEDVVAGIRNTIPLAELEQVDKAAYDELLAIMQKLEHHYKDLCDIEFTVEHGKLWMLQTRVGKRTAEAAFRIAHSFATEGIIDLDEAVDRVTGAQLAQLMFPRFDSDAERHLIGKGMNASPGAAVGKAVFDSQTAVEWAASGDDVILVRRTTTPDDLAGMVAAKGILTSRGGKTSHAAVVARGMGRTCVCGADELDVDTEAGQFTAADGTVVKEGDVISIDGTTGEIFEGAVDVVDSVVVRHFEGDEAAEGDDLVRAVTALMDHADDVRRLGVRANADTPADAARARRFGAQGIGLCRTEHMFLGERREYVEHLILADTPDEQHEALSALLPMQRDDFVGILEAMDGLPVTIRLLDPPLHEFLPDYTELAVQVAIEEEHGEDSPRTHKLLAAVKRLHEENPMLGLRGVRLGIVIPGLFTMQARAILEAAAARTAAGGDPRPEIMVPLVGDPQELELIKAEIIAVAAEVEQETGTKLTFMVGTMIELPRAVAVAGRIAKSAEFFSFGTNDLTQMTWGFSRDDVEASFFSTYLDKGIFAVSPFESLDIEGVGLLVEHAVKMGRKQRPDLHLGVCGEHGGDPASIHFFDEVGLDYVSCSPYRVPVARLEAGRSASATSASA